MSFRPPLARTHLLRAALISGFVSLLVPATSSAMSYGVHVDPVPPSQSGTGIGNGGLGDLTPQRAQTLYDGGIRKVRILVDWSDAQPEPENRTSGTTKWAKVDANINSAVGAGLRYTLIINHRPYWAETSSCLVPTDENRFPICETGRSNFADFINLLTNRYGSRSALDAIELWNEVTRSENSRYYDQPQENARKYAKLVSTARPYIRAQAPNAKIIVGALNRDNDDSLTFIEKFYQEPGIRNDFDIFSLHPYSRGDSSPTVAARVASAKDVNDRLVNTINKSEPGERIWVTEFGIASTSLNNDGGPYLNSDAEQSAFYDAMVGYFKNKEASYNQDVLFAYTLEDSNTASKWTDRAGLWFLNGGPKDAWGTYSGHARS